MSHVSEAIEAIRLELPQETHLIAVSKTHPVELIKDAYAIGQRDFGENKAQEMTAKHEALPADIRWHMIGHLQTNKVKYIAPYVYMIHSIDSLHLLELQVHVAKEETKFGLSPEGLNELLDAFGSADLKNVEICGLMGMATNTDDDKEVETEFAEIKSLFDNAKARFFATDDRFSEISMGMSGDYQIAVRNGSTMVRIGSGIFGARDYSKKD